MAQSEDITTLKKTVETCKNELNTSVGKFLNGYDGVLTAFGDFVDNVRSVNKFKSGFLEDMRKNFDTKPEKALDDIINKVLSPQGLLKKPTLK